MTIVSRICPLLFPIAIFLSGCAIEGRRGTLRFWADYNTLRAPALVVEQLSHYPDRGDRVRHLRWMYNKPPFEGPYMDGVLPAPAVSPARPLPPPPNNVPPEPSPVFPQPVPRPDVPAPGIPPLLEVPRPLPLVPPPEPLRLPTDEPPEPNSGGGELPRPMVPPAPAVYSL